MKRPLLRRFAATAITLGVIALGAVSCSDSPTQSRGHVDQLASPMAQLAAVGQTFQDEAPAELAGIDIDGAYNEPLFKPSGNVKGLFIDFAESNDESEAEFATRRWLLKAQEISAEDGGIIYFGNDRVGYSSIEFPAGALDEDEVITLVHKLKGKRDLFLFPEGLVFNEPVTVRFSLDGLNNRQTKKLLAMRLFYHSPDSGWELIPSYSDGSFVIATLEHFSRYAVGSDE